MVTLGPDWSVLDVLCMTVLDVVRGNICSVALRLRLSRTFSSMQCSIHDSNSVEIFLIFLDFSKEFDTQASLI